MNALRFISTDCSTVVFACKKCRKVVSSTVAFGDGPEAEATALELAERHCEPKVCTDCKSESANPHMLTCHRCTVVRQEKREKERFEKAAKIPLHEYGGAYLYLEGWTGDGYVQTEYIEDELADEHAYRDSRVLPRYAYACTPASLPKLDAHELLTDLCEKGEMHEEASDSIVGLDELQVALDAWHAKQTVTSYMVDHSRVVLLDALVDRLEREHLEQTVAKENETKP